MAIDNSTKILIRDLAEQFGQRVSFRKMKEDTSAFWSPPNKIYISPEDVEPITSFFHEAAHGFCYQHNIYPMFHYRTGQEIDLGKFRSVALRAETHVDRIGKNFCKTVFPELPWIHSYRTKKSQQWLLNYYR